MDVRTLSHRERSGALLVGMDFAQRLIPVWEGVFNAQQVGGEFTDGDLAGLT